MSVIDPFTGKIFDESMYAMHTHAREEQQDRDEYTPLSTLVKCYVHPEKVKQEYYDPAIKALLEFFERQQRAVLEYEEYIQKVKRERAAAYEVYCQKHELYRKNHEECLVAYQKWQTKNAFVRFFVGPDYPEYVANPELRADAVDPHPLTWELPSVKSIASGGRTTHPLVRVKDLR